MILSVFHLDISGIEDKIEHPPNMAFIFVTLFIFHKDISGISFKALHLKNNKRISDILKVFHNDIFGMEVNSMLPSNKLLIFFIICIPSRYVRHRY